MRKILRTLLLVVLALAMLTAVLGCGGADTPTKDPVTPPVGGEVKEREDKQFYFGMFGVAPNNSLQPSCPDFTKAVKEDLYNVYMLGTPDGANMDTYYGMVYDEGKKFWMYIQSTVWATTVNGPEVREDAYYQLNLLRDQIVGKRWYDALLGFHIDEPLLQRMSVDELYKGSKVIHDVFPEKRFWVNFAGFAFNEDIPSSNDRMTREAGEYISDLSFDLYGAMNDTIIETYDNMVAMFKGQNKYFWAIPMSMAYCFNTTEAQSIDHLEVFYDLLNKTDGGCGIVLYAGGTYPWSIEQLGNIGYFDLISTESEFKKWATKDKPWSTYYEKFYDKDGNPINGGFRPWTNLTAKIRDVWEDIKTHNTAAGKLDTELTAEENAVFEYDGASHCPTVYPTHLEYEYSFCEKGGEIFFADAPVDVGEYEVTVRLNETAYRKPKTLKTSFSIVESTKTLIAARDITETYSGNKFTVSINRDGLQYSFDNVNYQPYVKGTEIDLTPYVVRAKYGYCLYLKDGDKTPFVLPIRKYEEMSVFEFEGSADTSSSYRIVADKAYAGKQSAYCASGQPDGAGGFQNYFYFTSSDLANPNDYNLRSARLIEMYIWAEEDIDVKLSFWTAGWAARSMTVAATHVEGGGWQKAVFDLTQMDNDITLQSLMFMGFHTDKDVAYYVDHVIAVNL